MYRTRIALVAGVALGASAFAPTVSADRVSAWKLHGRSIIWQHHFLARNPARSNAVTTVSPPGYSRLRQVVAEYRRQTLVSKQARVTAERVQSQPLLQAHAQANDRARLSTPVVVTARAPSSKSLIISKPQLTVGGHVGSNRPVTMIGANVGSNGPVATLGGQAGPNRPPGIQSSMPSRASNIYTATVNRRPLPSQVPYTPPGQYTSVRDLPINNNDPNNDHVGFKCHAPPTHVTDFWDNPVASIVGLQDHYYTKADWPCDPTQICDLRDPGDADWYCKADDRITGVPANAQGVKTICAWDPHNNVICDGYLLNQPCDLRKDMDFSRPAAGDVRCMRPAVVCVTPVDSDATCDRYLWNQPCDPNNYEEVNTLLFGTFKCVVAFRRT